MEFLEEVVHNTSLSGSMCQLVDPVGMVSSLKILKLMHVWHYLVHVTCKWKSFESPWKVAWTFSVQDTAVFKSQMLQNAIFTLGTWA